MRDLFDMWFNGYRWYRRLCGGRWERWYVGCLGYYIWHRIGNRELSEGSWYAEYRKPTPVCTGKPVIEEW